MNQESRHQQSKSFIEFENYQVNESIFMLNQDFLEPEESIQLKTRFSIKHDYKSPEEVCVTIVCELFEADMVSINAPFYLKINMSGWFLLTEDPQDEQKRQTLHANTVAILFPYLRSAVTTLTSVANMNGLPPVILPPVNTYALLEQQSKEKNNAD